MELLGPIIRKCDLPLTKDGKRKGVESVSVVFERLLDAGLLAQTADRGRALRFEPVLPEGRERGTRPDLACSGGFLADRIGGKIRHGKPFIFKDLIWRKRAWRIFQPVVFTRYINGLRVWRIGSPYRERGRSRQKAELALRSAI